MTTLRTTAAACLIAALTVPLWLAAVQAQIIPPLPTDRSAIPPCPPGQRCTIVAPRYGLRCQTATFWCGLPQPAPVGLNCSCSSPTGVAAGRVTQ